MLSKVFPKYDLSHITTPPSNNGILVPRSGPNPDKKCLWLLGPASEICAKICFVEKSLKISEEGRGADEILRAL